MWCDAVCVDHEFFYGAEFSGFLALGYAVWRPAKELADVARFVYSFAKDETDGVRSLRTLIDQWDALA